jgi:prolyl-tRNA editing enzyme YbaK/EbsC (Cys-tRNA(Pro) deacylase)
VLGTLKTEPAASRADLLASPVAAALDRWPADAPVAVDDVLVAPIDADLADTAAFCAHYGYRLDESANCIVIVGKAEPRRHVACVTLADSRLDVNGLIRKRLGAKRTSFAGADETIEATRGMRIGGVTPFGLPADLPVWIDARVTERERVIIGGGTRRCKVFVASSALRSLPGAEVVTDLAKPVDPPAEVP